MGAHIDFIAPAAQSLEIAGAVYTVSPITMRHLPALVRTIEPALDDLLFVGQNPDPVGLVALLGRHGDAMLDGVVLCTGCTRDALELMQADQFAALAMLCVEVNADFFTRAWRSLVAAAPSLAPSLVQKLQTKPATAATPAPSTS
jgi:hypothetical protein